MAAADAPVVLISASAGYGKSTLAAQWSARCRRPVAWINLDRSDNDPIVFLDALAHALDRVDPAGSEILDEFGGACRRGSQTSSSPRLQPSSTACRRSS